MFSGQRGCHPRLSPKRHAGRSSGWRAMKSSSSSARWSIDVIHHEVLGAQTRRRRAFEYASSKSVRPIDHQDTIASARWLASCNARLRPLAPVGEDDVRGVADEKEPTVAHELGDVAPAYPVTPLLQHGPFCQRPAVEPEPKLWLSPGCARQAIPRDPRWGDTGCRGRLRLRIAQAQQGEAARAVGVDELIAGRSHRREDPEPARRTSRAPARGGRRPECSGGRRRGSHARRQRRA